MKIGRLGLISDKNNAVGYCDNLGFIPEDGSGACHHNVDPPRSDGVPGFVASRGILFNGNLENIAPTTHFTCNSAISVHGGVSTGGLKPGPTGSELRAVPTGPMRPYAKRKEVPLF